MNELSKYIKKIVEKTVSAGKPTDIHLATVTSADPLEAQITPQRPIYAGQLKVPKHLTDYEVEIEIDGAPKQCIVKNAIKAGDRIICIQESGGNQFYVLGVIP